MARVKIGYHTEVDENEENGADDEDCVFETAWEHSDTEEESNHPDHSQRFPGAFVDGKSFHRTQKGMAKESQEKIDETCGQRFLLENHEKKRAQT